MKRYYPCKNKFQINGAYSSPYKKKSKSKGSQSNISAFLKLALLKPVEDRKVGVRFWEKITVPETKFDNYILELDNHQSLQPHFHVWRANGGSRISDTRSSGISLTSSYNNGLVYTDKERKHEAKLTEVQQEELLTFVEENSLLLFCMCEALKQGKVKNFEMLDEAYVSSLFSDAEFYRIAEKYKRLTGENVPAEFGK